MTKHSKQFWIYLMGLGLLIGCNSDGGSQSSAQCGVQPATATARDAIKISSDTNRYIVKLRPMIQTLKARDLASFLKSRMGLLSKFEMLNQNFMLIEFERASNISGQLESLLKSNVIEYAEPDIRVHTLNTPNDPLFPNQWAHMKIQSSLAWDITRGSRTVVVAMLDTGVDYTHPDIRPNMWTNANETPNNGVDDDGNGYVDDYYGYDFANHDSNPMADDLDIFHGTHTAGTVGASSGNGIGIAGHAPIVKIMALKFMTADGAGDLSSAIRAIDYAINNGAKILNNSWGSDQSSLALSESILRAREAGVLFVAAAGNGGMDGIGDNNDTTPSYPANYRYENVISVTSTNSSDSLSRFSNFGASSVHLAAPGDGIVSTKNGGRYQTLSGTSMAAPLVSGVLALMISRRPDLSYLDIKNALLQSVDIVPELSGRVSSGGRINAYRALRAVAEGTPTVQTPASCP